MFNYSCKIRFQLPNVTDKDQLQAQPDPAATTGTRFSFNTNNQTVLSDQNPFSPASVGVRSASVGVRTASVGVRNMDTSLQLNTHTHTVCFGPRVVSVLS